MHCREKGCAPVEGEFVEEPDEKTTRTRGVENSTSEDGADASVTRCVDEGGVTGVAAGSGGEDDSERIIGTFERAPQLGQYFLLYPTGSGKTRKGAIFMLHLLRKGHVTRVVVIVPRHSLKRDTLLTYQAVFETHQRTQRDMSDVLKILTRKEFVNEWHAMTARDPGTPARLGDWWSPTEVYGVFVDEFHTIISRSAAMVDDCTVPSNAANDSFAEEEENKSSTHQWDRGEKSKRAARGGRVGGWTVDCRREKKKKAGCKKKTKKRQVKNSGGCGRGCVGKSKKRDDSAAPPPDKRARTNESDGGYASSSSSSSSSASNSSRSSSPSPPCEDTGDADDESEGPTGTDIVGYKGHARDAINQMRKHCPHNIFMCATATPFFTIFEKEVKMWVQIFEPSAAASLEDAMIYFGRRMITPTRAFVERVYSGVSVEIVGSDGTVGTPRMTEICAPVSASDFPLTGCNCGKCESEECYIERVMSEISNAREGKHFVVTYRYFVRDLLLDRLRRESTPCAAAGAAGGDSASSVGATKRPQEVPGGPPRVGGAASFLQQKKKVQKSARNRGGGRVHAHSGRGDEGLVGGGGTFASSSACAIRTFMWRDSVRVFYVLPDDPTNVVIQVRDEFNRERNRCIMVTNIFFCEGHTLRNVTHMHVLGAFPTYECGTMFQAFGRICRMKSHDSPTKVRVFMYDDDRMLHYRISKAVEKENEIRNGIKYMMKITERERQRQSHAGARSAKKKGGVADCCSDDDACGGVDYSQLVAPYLTETSVADPPTTDTIHQIVSRFKQSRYSYVHSEAGAGMCLQDVSISDYIRRRNKEAAMLQAKQRELKSKRGVQPQRYNAIWKFITKKKLGPNCIFISIPEDVIAAAVASAASDAACAKGESQAPVAKNKREDRVRRAARVGGGGDFGKKKRGRGAGPGEQQLVLTIRVDDASGLWSAFGPVAGSGANVQHAEGNAAGSATIKLPVTDVVVYNVRRHVICNEICRKMAKGALLINMPLSNIKRLQSGIIRNRTIGVSNRGGTGRCAAGAFPNAYSTAFFSPPHRTEDRSGEVGSRSEDEYSSLMSSSSSRSSSSSSSSSSTSDSSDVDGAASATKTKRRRARMKRSEKSLTRTRCDLIREILVWAAETECILVIK